MPEDNDLKGILDDIDPLLGAILYGFKEGPDWNRTKARLIDLGEGKLANDLNRKFNRYSPIIDREKTLSLGERDRYDQAVSKDIKDDTKYRVERKQSKSENINQKVLKGLTGERPTEVVDLPSFNPLRKGSQDNWIRLPNSKIKDPNLIPPTIEFELLDQLDTSGWSKEKKAIAKENPPSWLTKQIEDTSRMKSIPDADKILKHDKSLQPLSQKYLSEGKSLELYPGDEFGNNIVDQGTGKTSKRLKAPDANRPAEIELQKLLRQHNTRNFMDIPGVSTVETQTGFNIILPTKSKNGKQMVVSVVDSVENYDIETAKRGVKQLRESISKTLKNEFGMNKIDWFDATNKETLQEDILGMIDSYRENTKNSYLKTMGQKAADDYSKESAKIKGSLNTKLSKYQELINRVSNIETDMLLAQYGTKGRDDTIKMFVEKAPKNRAAFPDASNIEEGILPGPAPKAEPEDIKYIGKKPKTNENLKTYMREGDHKAKDVEKRVAKSRSAAFKTITDYEEKIRLAEIAFSNGEIGEKEYKSIVGKLKGEILELEEYLTKGVTTTRKPVDKSSFVNKILQKMIRKGR